MYCHKKKKTIFNNKLLTKFNSLIYNDKICFFSYDNNNCNLIIDISESILYFNLIVNGETYDYCCNNIKKSWLKSDNNNLVLYGNFKNDMKFKLNINKFGTNLNYPKSIVGNAVLIVYINNCEYHSKKYLIKTF